MYESSGEEHATQQQLRSRRIRSASFADGCKATGFVQGRDFTGHVVDVSQHGVLVQLSSGPIADLIAEGMVVSQIHVDFFGETLCEGSAIVVRRSESSEGDGVEVGLQMRESPVNVALLHEHSARLGARARWATCFQQVRAIVRTDADAPIEEWCTGIEGFLMKLEEFLGQEEARLYYADSVVADRTLRGIRAEIFEDFQSTLDAAVHVLARYDKASPGEVARARALIRDATERFGRLCPFTRRAIEKPLGYAGDYEMINMIYESELRGDSELGRVLNQYAKNQGATRATANRLRYLTDNVIGLLTNFKADRPMRITSVGCGGAQEMATVLDEAPHLGAKLELALLDQDDSALTFCERTLSHRVAATGASLEIFQASVLDIVKGTMVLPPSDFVYSAGLFDYLDDDQFVAVARALFLSVNPGGGLLIGNMSTHNASRYWMEFVLGWKLIYRDHEELMELMRRATGGSVTPWVEAEPDNVNLFVRVTTA